MNFIDLWPEDEQKRISVQVTPKKAVEETSIAPVFTHPGINNLYNYRYDIPMQLIDEIKTLPRPTLIKDLNAVVYDSIARYAVFRQPEYDAKATWFPIHAFFILRDIQAEESLEAILDFLSQDEDFLEFWLGDLLTEDMWYIVAACGHSNLSRLSSFMKEQGRFTYARIAVSEAVCQMALHEIIPKEKAIEWLGELVQYYIDHTKTPNLIDSNVNGALVDFFLNLHAAELSPLIEKMYQQDMVSKMFAGSWEEVKEDLKNGPPANALRIVHSIEKVYTQIKKVAESESRDLDNKFDELDEYSQEPDDDGFEFDDYEDYLPPAPYVRETPKIGRNEPCYCGSGKKFKKCHGT